MLRASYRTGTIVLACLGFAWLSGCTGARTSRSAYATAPGLNEDAPLDHGGANPNAPYTVVDHSAHLVKRPAILDVNGAEPCAAAELSLFESGARVDGERRSVRLNLVNHAKIPCRLSGYPAISLLRPDGTLIGSIAIEKVTRTKLEAALQPAGRAKVGVQAAAEVENQPAPEVLLAPGGEAAFEVGWTSGTQCDQVGMIAVAAPGTLQSFTVRHALTVCKGRILVTALSDGAEL
jgi:hypothetical protein